MLGHKHSYTVFL